MAASFDFEAKFLQSRRQFEAATLLLSSQFLKEAITLYWRSVRGCLFGWLEKRQVPFDGTRAALVAAMSNPALKDIRADLAFAYTVGTMAEWDEEFTITEEQVIQYKHTCEELMPYLLS